MRTIDLDGLEAVYNANVNSRDFILSRWVCGTYGCLIGNFCIKNTEDELQLGGEGRPMFKNRSGVRAVTNRFNISLNEALFLFGSKNMKFIMLSNGWVVRDVIGVRDYHDKNAALARLKKFIIYHREKRILTHDSENKVKESARRVGDVGINKKVTIGVI